MSLRSKIACLVTVGALASCSSSQEREPSAPLEGPSEPPRPTKIAGAQYEELGEWASPIDDYLAVGKKEHPDVFNRAITDLAPFGDRMFIGYGDANYNLGTYIPIEFRSIHSATTDEPVVEALDIEAAGQGGPQKTPRQSGEEQIDRYRSIDGELWQAGIDSTDVDELWTQANTNPKGIQGNVYRIEAAGDVVKKYRSIPGGEHVHDIQGYGGALYAVGSGADTRTEFEAGRVFRYLWRSTDRGVHFATVQRVETAEAGKRDTRFIHLLPTRDRLLVFGYEVTFATNAVETKHVTFDGNTVTDVPASETLAKIIPDGTLALPDGSGIMWGADLANTTFRSIAGRIGPDGAFTKLDALADSTVLDVSLTDTGEILYLAMAGDRKRTDPKTWDVRVLVSDEKTPDAITEVLRVRLPVRPVAIAHFRGALFLGTGDGRVLRAVTVQ